MDHQHPPHITPDLGIEDPFSSVLGSDQLWEQMERAARGGDQVLANVYFQAWLAMASALVNRSCDLLLRHEEDRRRAAPIVPPTAM